MIVAVDMVNHPPHYAISDNNIECIDAISEAVKDLRGMDAICTGNAIKYLWRWKKKNGIEDLKKAQWYLNYLIKMHEHAEQQSVTQLQERTGGTASPVRSSSPVEGRNDHRRVKGCRHIQGCDPASSPVFL